MQLAYLTKMARLIIVSSALSPIISRAKAELETSKRIRINEFISERCISRAAWLFFFPVRAYETCSTDTSEGGIALDFSRPLATHGDELTSRYVKPLTRGLARLSRANAVVHHLLFLTSTRFTIPGGRLEVRAQRIPPCRIFSGTYRDRSCESFNG
jgi:hypothetical protein